MTGGWGIGHVVRDAGGSTGQSRSAEKWPALVAEIHRRDAQREHPEVDGDGSRDEISEIFADLMFAHHGYFSPLINDEERARLTWVAEKLHAAGYRKVRDLEPETTPTEGN